MTFAEFSHGIFTLGLFWLLGSNKSNGAFNFYFGHRTIEQMKYIPELAYFGLRLLCSPLHGLEDQVKMTLLHTHLHFFSVSM